MEVLVQIELRKLERARALRPAQQPHRLIHTYMLPRYTPRIIQDYTTAAVISTQEVQKQGKSLIPRVVTSKKADKGKEKEVQKQKAEDW
ncbi:hypothetical protein BGZ65_006447 [Modicella reniformis]|uniref:Uncharacterized protein n=1 Tax=Modicella reniformis TaxID=1440133 RepID=A0A9P6JI46_9FUNG|nr:hypothetical protein BGZ65_006447 [Modicella reniformis]